jgi:glycosyltransferase involved in cell wall biosynthesis
MASYSIVTICVRRWDYLLRSLPGWRALPGRKNIFVVTYAFDDIPRAGLEQEHVVVIDSRPFHLTKARNTGARAAKQTDGPDYLLFIDADIVMADGPLFVKPLEAGPDCVLDAPHAILDLRPSLGGQRDPERTVRGLRGTHFVKPELFFKINGYNQQMKGWGYEDLDLFGRYARASGNVAYYDRSALRHQVHSDMVRRQMQAEPLEVTLRRNKAVAAGAWAGDFGYASFEIRPPRRGP